MSYPLAGSLGSSQTMWQPPWPSDAIVPKVFSANRWSPDAVHTGTPVGPHSHAARPSTACAKTSIEDPFRACKKATIAPPDSVGVIRGLPELSELNPSTTAKVSAQRRSGGNVDPLGVRYSQTTASPLTKATKAPPTPVVAAAGTDCPLSKQILTPSLTHPAAERATNARAMEPVAIRTRDVRMAAPPYWTGVGDIVQRPVVARPTRGSTRGRHEFKSLSASIAPEQGVFLTAHLHSRQVALPSHFGEQAWELRLSRQMTRMLNTDECKRAAWPALSRNASAQPQKKLDRSPHGARVA